MLKECQNNDYLNLLWSESQQKQRRRDDQRKPGWRVCKRLCQRVRGRSMDGQRGMAFGFQKAMEDVMIPEI